MHPLKLSLLSLAIGAGVSGQVCAAEDFSNLFTQGTPIVDARYRYEYVDQNAAKGKAALDQANAQTLLTRLGFQTGKW
jgi:hypothetical protein